MSSSKFALKNTAWLFGEKGFAMTLNLLVNIVLARYLAPDKFGQLNYLISFMAILAPFASVGLNALVTREVVNNNESTGTVLGTSFFMRLLGGFFALVVVIVAIVLFQLDLALSGHWFILAAIANSFTAGYVIDLYFQAKVKSHYVVKVRTAILVIASAAKFTAVSLSADLSTFLIIFIAEPIFTAILLFIVYKYVDGKEQWRVNKKYGFTLVHQSKWLIFSGFMSVIYLKIDQLMLGQMVGMDEVGVYAVAVRLSEVWYFFPAALVASFFPRLLLAKKESSQVYSKQLQQLCDVLFWSAVLLALVIYFCADFIVVLMFGENYVKSAILLQIHIWAGVFIFMRALLSKWFIAEHLLVFSLSTHGIAAVVNVLLNLWWIPLWGGEGAAWATLISYATSSYFVLWGNKKTRPMAIVMTKSVLFPVRFTKEK
jgi:O-antigen/teichoic acid export membrane protein